MPLKTKWTPFKMDVIRALPRYQSGVYEVGKAVGDLVLYIGRSESCIRGRLLSHKEKTKFRSCTHFRKSQTLPYDAKYGERKLIEAYERKHGKLPHINQNTPHVE